MAIIYFSVNWENTWDEKKKTFKISYTQRLKIFLLWRKDTWLNIIEQLKEKRECAIRYVFLNTGCCEEDKK